MRSITEIAFFRGIVDFDIAAFERRCIWRRFDAGQIIVDFDDQSSAVHFLQAGDVRILLRTRAARSSSLPT